MKHSILKYITVFYTKLYRDMRNIFCQVYLKRGLPLLGDLTIGVVIYFTKLCYTIQYCTKIGYNDC